MHRGKVGSWILDSDLAKCFDYIQIYYNPLVYKHLSSEYYACDREKINNFRPEHEIIVLEEIKQEDPTTQPENGGVIKTFTDIGSAINPQKEQIELLVSFNPSSFQTPDQLKPYCIIQKYDFDNLTCVSAYNSLSGVVDSIKIVKQNENSVFRLVTYSPTSFALTLAANAKFRLMSIPQYLGSPS